MFIYSIEKTRDKTRSYEVYLMKRLSGFDRTGWRTSFTNYRYVVPELAGRQGRAIYNDVDQIYVADPGELFDCNLNNHGFLAVSEQDTSVMLIDCARMSKVWSATAAKNQSKDDLLALTARTPGLWGPLEPDWNARDMEYVDGRSKLLHFTAMHLQPWQPFPGEYSYHPHPLGEIWHRLERAADAEGFQLFNAEQPSMAFRHALDAVYGDLDSKGDRVASSCGVQIEALPGVKTVLQIGIGAGAELQIATSNSVVIPANRIDISTGDKSWHAAKYDLSIAMQLLERAPSEDVPWLIDQLFKIATQQVCAVVRCFDHEPRDQRPKRVKCARDPSWWLDRFVAAAARYPRLAWELVTTCSASPVRLVKRSYRFRPKPASYADCPKVWLLTGGRAGDQAQLVGLAEKLGWPFDMKRLRYNPLSLLPNLVVGATRLSLKKRETDPIVGPWPDLILDCGRRSVPIARWIRSQSKGKTRWVHLGRPWAPLNWFDLVVSTPQYRVLQRSNVLQVTLPFHTATAERLASASIGWEQRLRELPKPWTAVLVGGNSTTHLFDLRAAERLGHLANATATASGGSLLVTTSPRTPQASALALKGVLGAPYLFHSWGQDLAENPYLAFLALADRIIVTSDSASMIAEACSTGKPVSLFELPKRPNILSALFRAFDKVTSSCGYGHNYRGLPRQQNWIARTFDRLVESGVFMPPRDMAAMQQLLLARGMVGRLGEASTNLMPRPLDDNSAAIDRIRTLMTIEQTSPS